ncbi:hypothetical protein KFK09_005573 [Dendrobium nobile]|uniref:DUF220 domain-containing protein n=1 Tax=Dendrobium nobile TaxID=94219 RepID=A0A8T3BYS1_DENNO|nr:hypothetical protein KFK09_005573 [Dendrobium nobile]
MFETTARFQMALAKDNKMKQSLDAHVCERQGWLATPSSLQELLMKIPHRLHNCLQSGLKKHKQKLDNTNFLAIGEKDSCKTWKVDLDRQMQAWRENSYWLDHPPELKVSVPEGSLCNLNVKCNVGLPPDAVFNIVIDPENKRVFKNIKEVISRRVLVDEGPRQVVEVEQAVIWRFLWWSGTMSIQVLVDQNRMDHTIKFKQGKSGFMKRFEGLWKVEPLFLDKELCSPCEPKSWLEYDTCSGGKGRVGSIVSLDQLIQPALVPPPPISWYLRGVTERTTEMLIYDLFAEARRLRGAAAMNSTPKHGLEAAHDQQREVAENRSTEIQERWRRQRVAAEADKIIGFAVNGSTDIKERWRHRRSKRKQSSYKALFADAC